MSRTRLILMTLILTACVDRSSGPCGDPPTLPTLRWIILDSEHVALDAADYRDLRAYHEHVRVYIECVQRGDDQ